MLYSIFFFLFSRVLSLFLTLLTIRWAHSSQFKQHLATMNHKQSACVCVCIVYMHRRSKYGVQNQAATAAKQRWITASLLGSAKNPSKSRAKMLENKAKRGKKTHTHYTSNKRNKRKKSTLECGQFYLYCLPLCLITCSSLVVVVFSPSLSHISHTFVHCIRNLLHPHERRASERMKKKVANRLYFYSRKKISIYEFLCVRASILVVEVH